MATTDDLPPKGGLSRDRLPPIQDTSDTPGMASTVACLTAIEAERAASEAGAPPFAPQFIYYRERLLPEEPDRD